MNADAELEALNAENFNAQHSLQRMEIRIGESSNISTELPQTVEDRFENDIRMEGNKDEFEVEFDVEVLEVEEEIYICIINTL